MPAKKRISKLVKDEEFKDEVQQRFKNWEKTVIMGNLLSHDNLLIENLSIREVARFCGAIHNLHDVFCCPACGNFIKYYQDLKKLRCPNSRCEDPIEIHC